MSCLVLGKLEGRGGGLLLPQSIHQQHLGLHHHQSPLTTRFGCWPWGINLSPLTSYLFFCPRPPPPPPPGNNGADYTALSSLRIFGTPLLGTGDLRNIKKQGT